MKKITGNWKKQLIRFAAVVALVMSLPGNASSITLIDALKNDLNIDQTNGVLPVKGDPNNPQHGDWYFHMLNGDQLSSSRYETNAWELKGTMGGNGNVAVAGSFMLMTRDGKYAYKDNSGNVRTMMYPANTDPNGVTVGNTSGRLFLLSSSDLQAVQPNPESSFADLIYYDDVDEKTNTVFEFDFPITTDNRGIESVTFDIQSSPPEGTKARFQVFNDVGDIVYENTDAFHLDTAGLVCVQGDNLVELDELFAVAAGVTFPSKWTFSNTVTIRGQGTGVDFKPYIKFSQIQLHVSDVVAIPSWLNLYRLQAGSFTDGDWIYEDHTIYKCNTTGAQSTDFDTNIALWDRLDDYPNPDVMVYKGGITVEDFNDLTSGTVGDVYRIIAGGAESDLVGGETALVGSTVTVRQDFSTTVTGADYDYFATEIDDSLIMDGDGDTHIKVEASTDEDHIRFTTFAGERMIVRDDGKVGIGTSSPAALTEFVGSPAGTIGGFTSGIIHVRNSDSAINSNAAITGHNANNTNRQLWYLGSTSDSNANIGFINRHAGSAYLENPSGSLTLQSDGDTAVTGDLLAAGDISVTGNLLAAVDGDSDLGAVGNGFGNAHISTLITTDPTFGINDGTTDRFATTATVTAIATAAHSVQVASTGIAFSGDTTIKNGGLLKLNEPGDASFWKMAVDGSSIFDMQENLMAESCFQFDASGYGYIGTGVLLDHRYVWDATSSYMYGSGGAAAKYLQIDATEIFSYSDFVPGGPDGTRSLGRLNAEWMEVWATNPAIQKSDEREKIIEELDPRIIKALSVMIPIQYVWKKAEWKNGKHIGFGAQTTRIAFASVGLNPDDWYGLQYDAETDQYSMSYVEFIAAILALSQSLETTVQAQQVLIEDLATRLLILEVRTRNF